MKLKICKFFIFCIIPSALCAEGYRDSRQYVNWNSSPYNNYVRICSDAGCGTGQFISSAHVLTAKGITDCCKVANKNECVVYTSDGRMYMASLVQAGGGTSNCKADAVAAQDNWAVLELDSRNISIERMNAGKFGLKGAGQKPSTTGLKRAGFGTLKILTDKDVQEIKDAYAKWLKVVYPYNIFERNKEEKRGVNLKFGNYDIAKNGGAQYKTFLNEFKKSTGKDFIQTYLNDGTRLKAVNNCKITGGDTVFMHSCSAWTGDAGGALLDSKNQIVGIEIYSDKVIDGYSKKIGLATKQLFPSIQKLFDKPIYAERRANSHQNDTIYKYVDGAVKMRTGGSVAWRNNNPGNLVSSASKIGSGGPVTDNYPKGKFAVFASKTEGLDALRGLLRSDGYKNKSILMAMKKYAPKKDSNNPIRYANMIAQRLGKSVDTIVGSLTDAERETMIDVIMLKEGWKVGNIIDCSVDPKLCQ